MLQAASLRQRGESSRFPALARARLAALNLALAAAYVLLALAGLELATVGKDISLVWPAIGAAYGALFIFGPALAPGVALGAFAANLLNGFPLAVALGIAAGNTLAPLAGAMLSHRLVASPQDLIRSVRGIGAMTLAGAYGGALLSASGGVAVLFAAGALGGGDAFRAWLTWWLGDALGVLTLAPVLLAWRYREPPAKGWLHAVELTAVAGCIIGLAALAFGGIDLGLGQPGMYLQLYLIIPFMIWLGLRFPPMTAAMVSLALAAVVTRLMAAGLGTPIAAGIGPRLEFVHGFLAITAFSALTLAAATSERRRTQAVLRESQARFKTLTQLSSDWYWELDKNLRLVRTAGRENFMSAVAAREQIGMLPWEMPYLDTQGLFWAEVRRRLEAHQPISDQVARSADSRGEWRYARLSGQPVFDDEGKFAGYRGVGRDVTREMRVQEALRMSEARYRSLADLSSDWYWEIDKAFRFTRFDGHGLNAVGLDTNDLLGKARWEVPFIEMSDEFWAGHRALLEAHLPFHELVLRWRDPNGVVRHSRIGGEPMFDELGTFIGYRGVGKDVTAEVDAQEALSVGAERLRTLIEATPDPVVMKDSDGRWIVANDAALRLSGLEGAAWFGRTDEELGRIARSGIVGPLPCVCGDLGRYEEGDVSRCEKCAVGEDGQERCFDIVGKALHDADGRLAGIVILCRDITHLKRAERVQQRQFDEIRRLNDELESRVRARTAALEASNRELEAFSYSVSHDLRSPLRALDGFSRMLEEDYEDKLGPEGVDYLRRIRRASQRMGELIDDLLDLSRITRTQARRVPVDLSARAAEIVRELREAEPERQVECLVAPGLSAQADAGLMQVVLENLLRNAWKFTRESGAPRIEFGREESGGREVFFVRDNGVGFDMEHAARLFSPFQRLHQLDRFEGTGIGLAIVQRIVRLHGGEVTAESAPERGATFYFTLG